MAARKRTIRREQERDARKLLEARAKLAALQTGGNPDDPEIVASASVIEPHAEREPCFACGGAVRVRDHRAERALRIVSVACKVCGRSRELFFRLRERTLN